MSADADPLPDSFDDLARTCERCGKKERDRTLLRDGLCRVCRDGGDDA